MDPARHAPSEVAPPLDALLAQVGWVRRLARVLVTDGHDAEDVEQETWRRALARTPAHGGNLRAWLAAIARNVARRMGRRRARREEREVESEDNAAAMHAALAPSTAEVVERAQLQRRVVDAVLALEEPYRSTILLRFFEELAPSAIAARTRVPVETVKTRLKRGLARLRVALRDCFEREGRSWRVALAAIREGAVVAASSTKAWVAAAAAVAVVAFVLPALLEPARRTEAAHSSSVARVVTSAAELRPVESGLAGEPLPVESAAALEPVQPQRDLSLDPEQILIEVVDAATSAPIGGARVAWAAEKALEPIRAALATDWPFTSDLRQPGGEYHRDEATSVDDCELLEQFGETALADRDGRLVISRPRGAASFAANDDERWALRRDVVCEDAEKITLALAREDCVRVKVIDRDERPLQGFTVGFGPRGDEMGVRSRRNCTGPDGIALLRGLRTLQQASERAGNFGEDWGVRLLVACAVPSWQSVDPERPPREPIVLVAPDTGSATLRFEGRWGQLSEVDFDLNVAFFAHVGGDGIETVLRRRLRARHGELELPAIGLGLTISVDARTLRFTEDQVEGGQWLVDRFQGPARAGEHVDALFTTNVGRVKVTGQLVDRTGRALTGAAMNVYVDELIVAGVRRKFESRPAKDGTSGADGRFDLSIPGLGGLEAESRARLLIAAAGDEVRLEPVLIDVERRTNGQVDVGVVSVLPR